MFRPRWLLLPAVLWVAAGISLAEGPTAKADPDGKTHWYDIRALGVEGQGWKDTKAPFDRLPARAEKLVRPAVWGLSRHSAGLCVRFVTDATSIKTRWTVTSDRLAMPHMPATGVSGLDLYVRGPGGRWQWLAVGRPTKTENTAQMVSGLPTGKHEFLLYLPLYNGVSAVEVGIPKGNTLAKGPSRPAGHEKPIVFYGTSITQGGCASRPGMVHTAILGRRLEQAVINLGFSGNGRMEAEVARLMAEVDAAVYVIDCLPNITAKEVAERTAPLVQILHKARPGTPILLVEDRSYANAAVLEGPRQRNATSRAALWKEYRKLVAAGMGGLHYLPGDRLLGDDGEGTVDGSHPTDLGFVRQADAFEKALKPLLSEPMPEKERKPVEGYTAQLSYRPGDEIAFHVSSVADRFSLEIARIGAERMVVWKKEGLPGKAYPVPANASSHGCGWPAAFRLKVPEDWKSGYYTGRMEVTLPGGKKGASELFFVVRPARPGKDTKILLQLCTNTYNAYSNWGGYSLYAYNGRDKVQGRRVSFNRPVHTQFPRWELPFVQWAEKAGYHLDYAVNSDLEFHPELLEHYRLILSVGHDEYWSAPMRDNLEKFIASGGNVAFFSGNTCCWQVRSEENGRALVCWKQSYRDDPFYLKGEHRLLSSLWSHHLVARPENLLTGVGFLWGGYHRSHGQFMDGSAAFTVHRPDHWLFAGTGLKRGDAFGGKDTIVGYECDGCELSWKDGLPSPTHRDGTPKSFEVLATCKARWHPDDSEWYERWEKGRTGNAVLGIYTRGGTVVTTGTTDWAHGLRGNDPAVVRITRNVLDRLSK
jgi:N,N-dimethylformamidase beta subunit-like, C-terminal/GDSL-like Lipase/Acylhydrolase family/N-terminus of Esterase_SGNH_hydro-type